MKPVYDWLLFAFGVVLALTGIYWMWTGWDIIQVERGWVSVISGAILISGGVVVAALAYAVMSARPAFVTREAAAGWAGRPSPLDILRAAGPPAASAAPSALAPPLAAVAAQAAPAAVAVAAGALAVDAVLARTASPDERPAVAASDPAPPPPASAGDERPFVFPPPPPAVADLERARSDDQGVLSRWLRRPKADSPDTRDVFENMDGTDARSVAEPAGDAELFADARDHDSAFEQALADVRRAAGAPAPNPGAAPDGVAQASSDAPADAPTHASSDAPIDALREGEAITHGHAPVVEPRADDRQEGASSEADPIDTLDAELSRALNRVEPVAREDAPPPPKPEPAILGRHTSGDTTYTMFADGSIEAETPDGVLRFDSLIELRRYVERV